MCGCLSSAPNWGPGPVLTGNETCDPLVHRLVLNPLSHMSQGHIAISYDDSVCPYLRPVHPRVREYHEWSSMGYVPTSALRGRVKLLWTIRRELYMTERGRYPQVRAGRCLLLQSEPLFSFCLLITLGRK